MTIKTRFLIIVTLMAISHQSAVAACTTFKHGGLYPTQANRYLCHIKTNHCLGNSGHLVNNVCNGYEQKSRFFFDEPNGVPLCQNMADALNYCNDVIADIGANSVITSRVYMAGVDRTKFKIRKNFAAGIGVDSHGTSTLLTHGFLIVEGPGELTAAQVNQATDVVTMYPVTAAYVGLGVDEDELDEADARSVNEPGLKSADAPQ